MLKKNEKVILIEENSYLGGNSTFGGFNTWSGESSNEGVHFKLANYLLENNKGGIGKIIGKVCKETPYSYSKIFENEIYESTLKRKDEIRAFHFEPEAMSKIMLQLLHSYSNLTIIFNTQLKEVITKNNRIKSVVVKNNIDNQLYEIRGKYFSDCTIDIVLARKTGCEYTIGQESHDEYKEALAPKVASDYIEGVSQVIRITKRNTKRMYKMPMEYINENTRKWMEDIYNYKQIAQINEYPNRDLNVTLPSTMVGKEYMSLSKEDRTYYLHSRMYGYFEFLTKHKGFETYKISYIFPQVGIREMYRLKGRYVLTQKDIINNTFKSNALCYCQQPITIGEKTIELKKVYGIAKDCILPKEYENLVVASRGSSFSHIVASSCKDERTLLALGEGAGKILFSMYKENT